MWNLIPLPYRLVIIAALLSLVAAGGVWLYDRTWDKGYDQHALETKAATAMVLAAHVAELVKKGEQHDKDQLTINRLAADIKRVRVNFPPTRCPTTATTPAGTGGGDGSFSDTVDAAFEYFQDQVGSLVQRCDQLNIDAIRSNK